MSNTLKAPICNRCQQPIDRATIELFARNRPCIPPRICGNCVATAIDAAMVANGLDPLFPDDWLVVRPGGR